MTDRLGVRGRLLLAFFGISAFAVLAAAAAMVSFLTAGRALQEITEDKVPATVALQKLSRQAERIAAVAPALLTVNTAEQHQPMSDRITGDLARLDMLLAALQGLDVDTTTITLIENLVERLRINLTTVDSMILNKLVLIEHRDELLRELGFTDIASRRTLAPGLLVLDAKLAELRATLESQSPESAVPGSTPGQLVAPISNLAPLRQAQAEVASINDMLTKAASATSEAELGVFVFPLRRALATLEGLISQLEPNLRGRLAPRANAFRAFAEGPDSLVAARGRELRHLALMEQLLADNVDISRRLTDGVDRLVFRADRDIQAASLEARTVQKTSTLVMVVVVVLSLVCSVLIVWLYVGRSLLARLTGLSDSMLAIARGELQTPIPAADGDELGRMSKALAVFRDTAVEVRETNLREIREARRRLSDAVESISEAFSLYDAEDRLVLCNSHYRDTLYPAIADHVVPGTSFETILRQAVGEGLIEDAKEEPETWIEQRLALHREPQRPHMQRQSDGRRIQVNERKTDDGGTVAVYADITELKRREEELDRKSTALELLSNQLAKFLPPQIYDSIFSGRQEVKVASSRKKLTVFFSDIAGFTETADRLESEELTQLVNHYLTEMSRIALEHGATIDKYMGDGILIFFGDPETRGVKQDALSCVDMAIAMRARLRRLADVWRESGLERPLQVRMGVHTGYCTVGNFGSEDRLDYTIIGGAVNLASRLESMATPGDILISYETFAQVKDHIQCEEVGKIEIRGIAYPLSTYRVVDTYENLRGVRRRFHEEHPNVTLDMALDGMTSDDRSQAATLLHRALDLLADDDSQAAPQSGTPADARREGGRRGKGGQD